MQHLRVPNIEFNTNFSYFRFDFFIRFLPHSFQVFVFLFSLFVSLQVYDSSVISYPAIVHTHGLVTTVQGLQMILDSSHFDDSAMRVKCLTSVSPVIPMHSSSSDASAAEARESGLSSYNGNRKTNYSQRKPPLTDSREAFLIGK